MRIRSNVVRLPRPRRETTPAEALRDLLRARQPQLTELRRRLGLRP